MQIHPINIHLREEPYRFYLYVYVQGYRTPILIFSKTFDKAVSTKSQNHRIAYPGKMPCGLLTAWVQYRWSDKLKPINLPKTMLKTVDDQIQLALTFPEIMSIEQVLTEQFSPASVVAQYIELQATLAPNLVVLDGGLLYKALTLKQGTEVRITVFRKILQLSFDPYLYIDVPDFVARDAALRQIQFDMQTGKVDKIRMSELPLGIISVESQIKSSFEDMVKGSILDPAHARNKIPYDPFKDEFIADNIFKFIDHFFGEETDEEEELDQSIDHIFIGGGILFNTNYDVQVEGFIIRIPQGIQTRAYAKLNNRLDQIVDDMDNLVIELVNLKTKIEVYYQGQQLIALKEVELLHGGQFKIIEGHFSHPVAKAVNLGESLIKGTILGQSLVKIIVALANGVGTGHVKQLYQPFDLKDLKSKDIQRYGLNKLESYLKAQIVELVKSTAVQLAQYEVDINKALNLNY
ncbi:MAG: hypothetical protein MK212_00225 [Saprospiraceae bacterium]|nr:hypothetical protein [Saprospiraceae bacterium]